MIQENKNTTNKQNMQQLNLRVEQLNMSMYGRL